MAECVARFGGIDIVVSNAGFFSPSQRIGAIDPQAWEQSLALNLSSHLYLLQAALPYLRLGFDPCVVIVGSKNVPAPGPGAAAYSAAKAGAHPARAGGRAGAAEQYGMTGEQYIRNNLLGVVITTADVANAVLALVGPAFAKTTGAQIPIDGGSDRVV